MTGPDEYTALVDDNVFTNLMATQPARRGRRRRGHPSWPAGSAWTGRGGRLAGRRRRDGHPVRHERGVHQQAAGFTDQPSGTSPNTGDDDYPLLLHFPYLELYRNQVVKQADLVLAMQRCPGEFTADEKAPNFAYYQARTVRDSSLSAAPQAVLAAEVGHLDLAYDLFAESVLQDLTDLGDKTGDGLHLASLGGAWLALVQGFGGLRDDRGVLSFDPRLPRPDRPARVQPALARSPAAGHVDSPTRPGTRCRTPTRTPRSSCGTTASACGSPPAPTVRPMPAVPDPVPSRPPRPVAAPPAADPGSGVPHGDTARAGAGGRSGGRGGGERCVHLRSSR